MEKSYNHLKPEEPATVMLMMRQGVTVHSGIVTLTNRRISESHENAMSTVFPTPHDRILRDGDCLRRPSRPRHPFSDNRVAERNGPAVPPVIS